MIELKSISKRYGNIQALKDLSLSVKKGSVTGLLGKNGAGKSTLMNILVGNLRQDAGTVRIQGYDLQEDSLAAKRAFGYLPENAPVYPELTVSEYLCFAARLNRLPKARVKESVEKALESLDLCSLRHRLIAAMSKGQRQRVALGQAMFCTPAKILILDEPTSGLDPSQIAQFRSMIRRMGGEYTILLSSHILSDITDVCDEIAVIDGGRLVAQGAIDDLIDRYATHTRLELTVQTDPRVLLDRLRQHPDVLEAHISKKTPEQHSRLILECSRDIRSDVFRMAVETDAVLLNMTSPESTLDHIFARVTESRREEL